MLDDHGFAAAIGWYAKQFTRRTGVAVSVQASEPDERLAPEVEMALFRIVQEALTNVAKHARAEHVALTLRRSASEFVMSIVDDGVGLTKSAQALEPQNPALGLVTMRERAQAVGGAFKVESLPDGVGTRLTVRVPL
jgi:signal transduction histidine kinase